MRKKQQKLAMEDYLDFIDNRALDLTATQLRQIIGMHGFKKMKFQKSLTIDMVSTMDLMDLRRSTLLDGGVSGDACFTLEEVIKDIKDLDWQECHVTSLLTQGTAVSSSGAAAVSVKRKRERKRSKGLGKKPIEVGADNSAISTGTTVAAGSTTTSLRSVDCNSLAAVSCSASPPIISLLTGRQLHHLMKPKKLLITNV